jgi:hypothetical protein
VSKYAEHFITDPKEAYGACREVTERLAAQFPELRRVRGHYYCVTWGERAHWWLVDPEGNIVDPTASQFPSKGKGQYVEWVEGTKEPTGRCPNCGDLCYDGGYCCSENCGIAYAAYCSNLQTTKFGT